MNLQIAASLSRRLRGLAGRRCSVGEGEVLALVPCNAVHTYTMRRPVDVAFVDAAGVVRRTYRGLAPRRRIACRQACLVLERLSPVGDDRWEGEVPRFALTPHEDGWFCVGDRVALVARAHEDVSRFRDGEVL